MKTKDKMIGAGLGIAALAAAGTYFLYGKRGVNNRKAIAGWVLQLKGQVLEKLEQIKKVGGVESKISKQVRTHRVSATGEIALEGTSGSDDDSCPF